MKKELLDAVKEPSVAELKFRLRRRETKYHLFFEGKTDKLFYIEMLRRTKPDFDGFAIYECGSRYAVINSFKRISTRPSEVCLFFVDRDSQTPKDEGADGIYVTDYYSFESHLIDQQVFEAFLKRNLGLTNPADRKAYLERFDRFRTSLGLTLRRLTCLKAVYDETNEKSLSWKKIPLGHISVVGSDGRIAKSNCCKSFFYNKFPDGIGRSEYEKALRRSETRTDFLFFRGKSALVYFIWFLTSCIENAVKIGNLGIVKINDTSHENIVMLLAPFCEIPETLAKFLEQNISA